jgi:hypothetical protein
VGFIYVVQCNFTCAEREQAWNRWYNGPKLANMLAKPMFLSGQRFKASGLDTRVQYLAVWELESPAAFDTEEYRSDWGFADWRDCIGDWNRDLCQLEGEPPRGVVACADDQQLHLVRIEAEDEAVAAQLRDGITAKHPKLMWGASAGLDRSAAWVGLALIGVDEAPAALDPQPGVRETVFRPLIGYTLAGVHS